MFWILAAEVSCILMNSPEVLSFQLCGDLAIKGSFSVKIVRSNKFIEMTF